MEHETSQNLIKVELTVKQLTSILINFDYLAKQAGKNTSRFIVDTILKK